MFDSRSARGFLVHTPCGPRKSGMPESVDMPAPVSATTRFPRNIHCATRRASGCSDIYLRLVWYGGNTLVPHDGIVRRVLRGTTTRIHRACRWALARRPRRRNDGGRALDLIRLGGAPKDHCHPVLRRTNAVHASVSGGTRPEHCLRVID